jgi:hypothetical protein
MCERGGLLKTIDELMKLKALSRARERVRQLERELYGDSSGPGPIRGPRVLEPASAAPHRIGDVEGALRRYPGWPVAT